MDNGQGSFPKLFADLKPLILKLSGTSDYKKLRFTFEDMESFFYEKLLYVWNKYEGITPYEEIKAIAISSLHNYRSKIYRKYSKEVSMEDYTPELADILEEDNRNLLKEAEPYLSEAQLFVLKLLVEPPLYVEHRTTPGKRIPSRLLLEFIDAPTDKPSVKQMNTLRRDIFATLRERVPVT